MAKIIGNTTATPNPRPDWEQTDEKKADYIKNKPKVLTEEDVIQLIEENGGDAGVQADWGQTDETQLDYIKNKPNIAVGEGTRADQSGQTVIGRYNAPDNTAKFIVGDGSATTRANCFATGTFEDQAYITIGEEKLTEGQLKSIKDGLGDISSALDSIIAIQNSFLPITFTVDYPIINGYGIELHAKAGMTWEAWVHSEYNVEIQTDRMVDTLLYQDGEYLHGTWGDEVVYNSQGERQELSDVIVAGEYYHCR